MALQRRLKRSMTWSGLALALAGSAVGRVCSVHGARVEGRRGRGKGQMAPGQAGHALHPQLAALGCGGVWSFEGGWTIAWLGGGFPTVDLGWAHPPTLGGSFEPGGTSPRAARRPRGRGSPPLDSPLPRSAALLEVGSVEVPPPSQGAGPGWGWVPARARPPSPFFRRCRRVSLS